jgi:hypothetical protein
MRDNSYDRTIERNDVQKSQNKKGGPTGPPFVSLRCCHQLLLPPITARTVLSGPKSSAPST